MALNEVAPIPVTASPAADSPPGGDITTLDRTMGAEDALVHDTLCALQAPSGVTRLADMLGAAGFRTLRGSAFSPVETRRVVDRLLAAGHASRDSQGRLRATQPHGAQRFVSMMHDPAQARMWFQAWCQLTDFERVSSLGFQEEEQLAAAMRLVIYGSGALAPLERLGQRAYTFTHLWGAALRRAVLEPFDAALFSRLEPALQTRLCESQLAQISGFAESQVRPLEDWLLTQCAVDAQRVTPALRLRLCETLLWRGDSAGARALCGSVGGPLAAMLQALISIAEGHWDTGAAAFEAAIKPAAAELGRRKNLASPSMAWLYVMGLLAQPTPEAWMRARKFVASEAGAAASKRGADTFGYWGVWLAGIDQRLGDAAKNPKLFCLAPRQHGQMASLQYLHHLLLAAWLRLPVGAPAKLRAHAHDLAVAFDQARLFWLGRQARLAAASLLGETAEPADAGAPFFVGAAQDRWRDALASILALAPTDVAGRDAAGAGRLIWVVRTADDGRIQSIEPLEQKAGPRGLGKPKAASLATLAKRKDLAVHDAALLRAVQRDDYGNRVVLDIATAAQALVRHPHVAWHTDPARFIEVNEALPALEIMTRGEHIQFRLLDPVRDDTEADPVNDCMPQRWLAQRARLRQIMLLPDGGSRARLVRLTAAQLRVAELVSQGWQVPVAARAELDAAMRVLAGHFQVASDADAGHEVAASSLLHAELTPQGSGLALSLRAAPFGDFGPRLPPGQGRERVTTVHQGVTLSTRRDRAAEMQARQGLLDAADFLDHEGHDWLLDEPDAALAVVETLGRLGTTIVSEWPKGKPLRVRTVADAAVRLSASSKGQWLELEGELALDDGEVLRLRQLLDMAQASRSRYVALGEGDFLALSDALRQQLKDLDALAQPHKGGQRLSGVAALAWEAGGHGLRLDGDTSWQKRSQAWADAQGKHFEAPAGLATELRDYQLAGYRWLMRLSDSGFGAVLADDMGLGKTVQTLGMLLQRAAGGPALVVAPTSVCGNWMLEAARFAPGLSFELYGDGLDSDDVDDERLPASANDVAETAPAANERQSARRGARSRQVRALGPGQVLVCSYALLQIDAAILTAVAWHSVVLDEAQAIKNGGTRRAKAALALQSDFRLALTGTPIENRLGELWSIMAFCNPGLLGSAEQFARHFGNPIERGEDPHVKAQVSRRLRRLLSPFLLRRTKAEVLTDLPPRTEIVHEVVPGARERTLLEALRQQAEQSVASAMSAGGAGPGQGRFQVLAALTRLRRAACDPRLVAPELGLVGAKVHEFELLALELVAGRHKALVFSQFTDFLALLRERLDAAGLHYQYLDGSTPAAERNKRIAAFQAGQGDLFLISLKAGGFGLNLTMADYVIITDPWWNPASEEQASARAHRIGQQRPVTVYRLVTQGSIEEKIVRLHHCKRDLAEGILSGEEASAPVDAAQLLALLQAP